MLHYLLDGNNIIGKDKNLSVIQKKDKQLSREKLAFIVDNYFNNKKIKVTVCFDGFAGASIKTSKIGIMYSDKKTADEIIRKQIEMNKNPSNIIVVTSDWSLSNFASICRCKVINSENFLKLMNKRDFSDDEESKIRSISKEEIKKLFKE